MQRVSANDMAQDGNLNIIYINEKLKREDWHTFEVGKTRFNDQALKKAGKRRETRPKFHARSDEGDS